MLELHKESDTRTAAKNAALAVASILTRYKNIPVLFLVSGGSPLEILKQLTPDVFDARITVGVSDERFSTDPTINNFAQVIEMPWYKAVLDKGVHVIDSRPLAGETVEDAGRRFDAILKTWKKTNPTGKIVITQGIGLDGHTAGMMPASTREDASSTRGGPYPEDAHAFGVLFDAPEIWAVGYDAKQKNKYPLRVTTTMSFLRMVDDSILFACGEDKKKPLVNVLAKEGTLAVTPGRIIHQMKHCLLFTDQQV